MDYSKIITQIKPSIALVFSIDEQGKVAGKGSGFIYSKEGIIVTCNHVVEKGSNAKIQFCDNKEALIDAKVVIRDEEHDLALLKFDDKKRKPLLRADVKTVKEGIPIIIAGYPFRMRNLTVHQGILSAIVKDATGIETYLIDGTVNAGDSGCPLMTKDGKVIGVVNAGRRERSDLLSQVEEMTTGAISLYGTDMVEIYQALIQNLQLGIGYAVPCSYIPKHCDAKIPINKSDVPKLNGNVKPKGKKPNKKQ